jgi:GH43 family beta-xylosidase
MSSPTTLSSERICISTPTRKWEIQGGSPMINEAPSVIVDGDYLTILYSASGSWCDDYCVGQLLFLGGDVLESKNWKKISEPVLQKQPEKFYGPGHCCIVPDENGVLWMAFHANAESGKGWAGRSGWMYPIRINEKGIVEVILY